MARREMTARRLVVDGEIFLWSLRHRHHALGNGRYEGCCEALVIRRFKSRGCLRIAFEEGRGRLVPGGYLTHSGAVGMAGGAFLNLHEPGTVRALIDEALAEGWSPGDPATTAMDGWALFDTVARRRGALPPA
ncbi:hypothetical protein [Streptomyces sp. C10]|uniref:hypothetical protein n=1 Tax=Streptomyces sp. C10 TaxID=531941 RepID=UPI0039803712